MSACRHTAADASMAPDGGGTVYDATIEMPIAIRDPGKRIGTHVFTAVARADAGLRWTAVTIDEGDAAANALGRIAIPKEVLAPINHDGTYVVAPLPLGEATISIKRFNAPTAPPARSALRLAPLPAGTMAASPTASAPPARYASAGNGLSLTVTGGSQTHDIPLTP